MTDPRTRYAFYIPFNLYGQDQRRKSWHARAGAHAEWWMKRADILREVTLWSLAQQKEQGFSVVVPVLPVDRKRYDPVKRIVERYGRNHFDSNYVFHVDERTYDIYGWLMDPFNWMQQAVKGFDYLVMIRLDSDDMYASDMFSHVKKAVPSPGLVHLCHNGYIWHRKQNKLAEWNAKGNPGPFYAVTYTAESLESEETLDAYREEFKLKNYHNTMTHAANKRMIPHGSFCYVLHDRNLSNGFDNKHTRQHMGEEIVGPERSRILERFGQ